MKNFRSLMESIRERYRVPAKRGGRVWTKRGPGRIVGAGGTCTLRVRLDAEERSRLFHPDSVVYVPKGGLA